MNEKLAARCKVIPHHSGVYLFKDRKNRVIYIGKAKDLKKRVGWYFQKSAQRGPKISALIRKFYDLEILKTDSELEALILEANLIKEHRPRYNVAFIDDKNYPFLKISTEEEFPAVSISRRRQPMGLFFGPFSGGGRLQPALKSLRDLFPLRICKKFKKRIQPCLEFQIKKCAGPCAGRISAEDYRRLVEEAVMFLKGEYESLKDRLADQMRRAAGEQDFEKAARLRDRLKTLEVFWEKQKAILPSCRNIDLIVLSGQESQIAVGVVFIRTGRWVDQRQFFLANPAGLDLEVCLENFLVQFYQNVSFLPELILTNVSLKNPKLLEDFFLKSKKHSVTINQPKKGLLKKVLELARQNLIIFQKKMTGGEIIEQLKSDLKLRVLPERVFAFDVSNLAAEAMVGSLVVFFRGQPNRAEFRRFIIRGLAAKPDDPAAIGEVVQRGLNLKRRKNEPRPDLILIDGGQLQLKAAFAASRAAGLAGCPLIALAKKEEKIFFMDRSVQKLPASSTSLRLLQRIRDEAHRFAHTFHRRRRLKTLKENFTGKKI